MGPRVGPDRCKQILISRTGAQIPNRPAPSESPYRLRYDGPSSTILLLLLASQPIVGLYSQPFSGLLASSYEVSRSHTTTRHSR